MSNENGYNGWANYETWNVALWVGNDEGLYRIARGCHNSSAGDGGYALLVSQLSELGITETGDGVSYTDPELDTDELDEMIEELDE